MVDRAKANLIVMDIETGMSLRKACEKHRLPNCTFIRWTKLDEDLAKQYARAKDVSLDLMADETLEIADEHEDTNKARLQVDTRKWYLSKLAPKRYGDKLAVTGGGDDDPPLRIEHSIGREAAELVGQLLKGIKDGE